MNLNTDMKVHKLFRFAAALLTAFTLFSCKALVRDELDNLQRQIDELRIQINNLNGNISSIQQVITEINQGGYITGISDIVEGGVVVGYTLTFNDSHTIRIVNGKDGAPGKDGTSPQIGLVQDVDDVWYWTLDGEWMRDENGNKIQAMGKDGASGITPQFKIEEGFWYVSYDSGISWNILGKAVGESGDSFFAGVDASSPDYVVLTLADGSSIEVPRYKLFSISFDYEEEDNTIAPGETIFIPYRLSEGVTEDYLVTASSDGNYQVSVQTHGLTSGVLSITCPKSYVDGYINVTVYDGHGHAVVRVISFSRRRMTILNGMDYYVDTAGGQVYVPYVANFDFVLQYQNGCDSWIECLQTKAEYSGNMVFQVSKNPLDEIRVGTIDICPAANPGFAYYSINITQSSAYFYIDQPRINVPSDGGEYRVTMNSSRGVVVRPKENYDWVYYSLSEQGDFYWMDLVVDKNRADTERNAIFELYTASNDVKMGECIVHQLSFQTDNERAMVLGVSANYANDGVVYLPLKDKVDCYIDWGDGSFDLVDRRVEYDEWISHKYSYTEPSSFNVEIYGTVERLSSDQMPIINGIREVKQWGDLELRNMSNAFSGCSQLRSVAPDKLGAFSRVSEFYYAFSRCTRLESVPEDLFAYCPNATSLFAVFEGCKSLTTVPGKLFENCPNVTNFSNAFNESGISTIPEGLFEQCSKVVEISSIFRRTPIKKIPADLFSPFTQLRNAYYAFNECKDLESVPNNLFIHCKLLRNVENMFSYSGLKVIPVDIFDSCIYLDNVSWCFSGLNNWEGVVDGESPYTLINGVKVHLYERYLYPDYFDTPYSHEGCFGGCSNLTDYESMPQDWK